MAATIKVLKKLKNHPTHKTKPVQELKQLAIELIIPCTSEDSREICPLISS